jgi:hypothetical protein
MHIYSNIPNDLIHIILEYDGRIKYKNGIYVNIVNKNDERYNIIKPLINKKLEIMKKIEITNSGSGSCFYFEFNFELDKRIGLVYDYNFSYANKFEICYYDLRTDEIKQIRTYI